MRCIRCNAPVDVDANLNRLSSCDCDLIQDLLNDEDQEAVMKRLDKITEDLNRELAAIIKRNRAKGIE